MKAGGADAGARESHIIEKMKSSAAAGGNSNTNANTTSSGGGSGAAAAAAAAAKGSGSDTVGGSHATTEANSNLLRALRMSEATNETGYATLQQLGRQKETIGRTLDSVGETRSELRGAQRTIRDIRMGVYKEWIVKGLVLLLLLLLDLVLFYTKFIRKR
ncbi:putative Qa-SNARE protein [Trypanosoma grayi]|uniref:putative Qa-SNARE protein n=1 Tax=Trypanosoma grayi TaxID=71804 RepID=UPI0004F41580|nr:putative Qa-SNARE protein [Trypanosoma grayi]KEG06337.1 putative Qa-SNARE protein [Trypanosoma grayi]